MRIGIIIIIAGIISIVTPLEEVYDVASDYSADT